MLASHIALDFVFGKIFDNTVLDRSIDKLRSCDAIWFLNQQLYEHLLNVTERNSFLLRATPITSVFFTFLDVKKALYPATSQIK